MSLIQWKYESSFSPCDPLMSETRTSLGKRELQYFRVIFVQTFLLLSFSPLFSVFFFCVLKTAFPPLERFSLSHALPTPSFLDPLFTFLFTRYTIWVVFKQTWTFALFWFYLWPKKQSTLTWNRHWIAYGGNLQSTDAWKAPKRKQSPAVLPCL